MTKRSVSFTPRETHSLLAMLSDGIEMHRDTALRIRDKLLVSETHTVSSVTVPKGVGYREYQMQRGGPVEIYLIAQRGADGYFNKLCKVVPCQRYGKWQEIFEEAEEAEEALAAIDKEIRPFYSIFMAEITVDPVPLGGTP